MLQALRMNDGDSVSDDLFSEEDEDEETVAGPAAASHLRASLQRWKSSWPRLSMRLAHRKSPEQAGPHNATTA